VRPCSNGCHLNGGTQTARKETTREQSAP
jgi:hypothetical protein